MYAAGKEMYLELFSQQQVRSVAGQSEGGPGSLYPNAVCSVPIDGSKGLRVGIPSAFPLKKTKPRVRSQKKQLIYTYVPEPGSIVHPRKLSCSARTKS